MRTFLARSTYSADATANARPGGQRERLLRAGEHEVETPTRRRVISAPPAPETLSTISHRAMPVRDRAMARTSVSTPVDVSECATVTAANVLRLQRALDDVEIERRDPTARRRAPRVRPHDSATSANRSENPPLTSERIGAIAARLRIAISMNPVADVVPT